MPDAGMTMSGILDQVESAVSANVVRSVDECRESSLTSFIRKLVVEYALDLNRDKIRHRSQPCTHPFFGKPKIVR